ncbi:cyclic nucleotide-binding domain-containing protein [Syntrophomonas wolfei]|uniref:cyclic nucleotide-binding domain-containing protein n=1 Tax=Syntrophomonas wolfei TaxID=863 RepID=UPI0009E70A19|nr:cyclic nucleotide-binding domain-containing protein [Syntrophomonas wolfei]
MFALGKQLLVRPDDTHRLRLMIPVFFSLGVGEVLGISSSTAIFNVRYGVEYLPLMYVLEAAGLLLLSLLIADLSGRMDRSRFLRLTYGMMAGIVLLNGLVLVLSKFSAFSLWPVFYPILLVTSMVVFFQLTPLIWLIALDVCSTQQAKRLFPLMAGASTIGCIAAGVIGKLLTPIGVEIIYLFWSLFLLGGGYYLFQTIEYYISPLKALTVEEPPNLKNSIVSIYRSRFLLGMLSLLTLIMTLYFLMDYQFNTVARIAYNDEAQLAGFLAIFLAISNVVAVVIELGFLSRIMSLLGVGNVLLLVVAGLACSFIITIIFTSGPWALGAVFISYLITKIMVNVLGEPSYQLLFKVIPPSGRDGIRFLVEALIILGGMIGGAAVSGLYSAGIITMQSMLVSALILAIIAAFVAWKTRGMYLNELLRSIGNGVKDLSENGAAFLGRYVPSTFLTQLFSFLHHPDDRKRILALGIAEQLDSHALEPRLGDLLNDSCADVRRSALKYCLRLDNTSYHQESIMACCMDEEPEVRAAAIDLWPALNLDRHQLYQALNDSDSLVVAHAVAAICSLEQAINYPKVIDAVKRCLDKGETSAATICQAISSAGLDEFSPRLISMLDSSPQLRTAACEALGKLQICNSIPRIIDIYSKGDRDFHKVADQALIDMGEDAVPILLDEINKQSDLRSWLGIIKALSAFNREDRHSRLLIDSCLQRLEQLAVFKEVPSLIKSLNYADLANVAFLRYQEIYSLQIEGCWAVLGSIYDPLVVSRVRTASQDEDIELREISLEALSEGLVDRRLARAMLEAMVSPATIPKPSADIVKAKLKKAQSLDDYWFSEISTAALSRLKGGNTMKDREMLSLLDKVMLLKSVELFSYLQLEELGLLARAASLEIYDEGTVLVQEGQANSNLYVIIDGHIELSAHSAGTGVNATIAVRGTGETLGDSSVFDQSASSLTAQIILSEATLLIIDGKDMHRLCSLYPNIAMGFIKAISGRNRKLEKMLITMA